MQNLINEFRAQNQRCPVEVWDRGISEHCLLHNLAMAKARDVFHADDCYLGELEEVVAACEYHGELSEVIKKRLFDVVVNSGDHRDLLLNCRVIGYSFYTYDYVAYLTIRGK